MDSKKVAQLKQRLVEYLEAQVELGFFSGSVLIATGEKVILKQGFGRANFEHDCPNLPRTKFRIASLTKQFTAVSILLLQEEGLLQVNDQLSKFLPNYPQGEQITLHHLLSNTSGIPNIIFIPEIMHTTRNYHSLDSLLSKIECQPLEFTPGERFSYSNSGYIILGKVIEIVSGQSYADFLQARIFKVLEMSETGFDRYQSILKDRATGYTLNGDGLENAEFLDMSVMSASAGLYSTIEDLYRWERALYDSNFLSSALQKMLFTAHVKMNGKAYGYGWYLEEEQLSHDGMVYGFRSKLLRFLKDRTVLIILGNIDLISIDLIAQALTNILYNRVYQWPVLPEKIEVTQRHLECYLGTYQNEGRVGNLCNLRFESGKVLLEYFRYAKQLVVEIFCSQITEISILLFAKALELTVKLEMVEAKSESRITLGWNGEETRGLKKVE